MAENYPVLLNVRGRRCVVVGGGAVAARKIATLRECGAEVRVVSPEAEKEIADLAAAGTVAWERREFRDGDLAGAFLGVAATDDAQVNQRVRAEAKAQGVLVNLVDDPEGSDYQVPSFFSDGPLLVALSTGGASPAVARTLRRMIQSYLGNRFGEALAIIADFRENQVKTEIADAKARGRFWEEAVTPELLEKVRSGDLTGMKRTLEATLTSFQTGEAQRRRE